MDKRSEVTENEIQTRRTDLWHNFHATADGASPTTIEGRKAAGAPEQAASAVAHRVGANPVAVGLIAFGAGWLISSAIRASDRKAQPAGRPADAAADLEDSPQ